MASLKFIIELRKPVIDTFRTIIYLSTFINKNLYTMKKKMIYFLILLICGLINSYSQETFHITHISIDNGTLVKEKYSLGYDLDFSSIGILDFNQGGVKIYEYGPVELTNTTYEQGLYIEEYAPTKEKLLNTPKDEKLHLFKFAYDKKGGKPVMIVEASGLSKSKNFQRKYYYTDYYFELKDKR
ncbi:hypothetical protein [Moheibacter sediminis]|uniref:Uncharacterized protein n=1 Tax=Moheibacter sediminis TaxID=1434700 RepID=A0A1W1YBW1_9FLAO|nr:hypothetical protein [Moheibacter sediminis]SMC33662.1 hypothetical protein SAMN06296427_101242 [Moheibacter sediminis]